MQYQTVSTKLSWWVCWSLNNCVLAIFNLQSILQKYQPVSTCICQCLSQLCCMCLCKLKTTCPESCCLYFMNIIIVESSLLPFHSSFIFPPCFPFHLPSQSMANFQGSENILYIGSHCIGSSVLWIMLCCQCLLQDSSEALWSNFLCCPQLVSLSSQASLDFQILRLTKAILILVNSEKIYFSNGFVWSSWSAMCICTGL